MQIVKDKSVSIRLVPADYEKLESEARRRFSKPASMGTVLLSQQLRRLTHPAIDFQELPEGGAVARVAGRRLAVWLAVHEVKRAGKKKAAELLELPASLLVAALNYAAEYPEEIAEDARRGQRSLKECGLEVPA
jgi:hypothetical protein